ncbi:MAG: hypothetical protein KGJ09_10745 [Candidatus Omnitrophica bacterium]|nr:hypothetical protein [Candidatus Omnitrophota bacterium]MDE2215512.1 hypothetical protein [Candidatus Omnitrophota bacterium]
MGEIGGVFEMEFVRGIATTGSEPVEAAAMAEAGDKIFLPFGQKQVALPQCHQEVEAIEVPIRSSRNIIFW